MSPALVDEIVMVVGNPGLVRVAVQVPPLPGTTLVGLHVNDERLGFGSKDRVVVCVDELREAVITAVPKEATVPAVAVKLAVDAVADTVTEPGTVTIELLEDRLTAVPPVGAAEESVTVQEVLALVAKLDAVHVRDDRAKRRHQRNSDRRRVAIKRSRDRGAGVGRDRPGGCGKNCRGGCCRHGDRSRNRQVRIIGGQTYGSTPSRRGARQSHGTRSISVRH